MFLYRGRAEMLAVLTVLSLGNTQWDASTSQLLVTVSSRPSQPLQPLRSRIALPTAVAAAAAHRATAAVIATAAATSTFR